MRNKDDALVYDGELGWIDPEYPLGSVGVQTKVDFGRSWVTYQDIGTCGPFQGRKYTFPLDRHSLMVLKRCIEDATDRLAKEQP